MPNLPTHIDLAHQAAVRLGHPTVDSNIGYYLLGSTTPDMRAMTRRTREEYHFAPLDFEAVGAGVEGLFAAHPHLLPDSESVGATRAFVAGYMTHLVLDEAWIVEMFRPCFGNLDVFHDDVDGKVMDRALQLELDRLSHKAVKSAVPLLAAATNSVDVGFISSETLNDWQRWVVEFVQRDFTWERLRFMARRIAAGDDSHPAHQVADDFLRAMPSSLERLFEYVPPDDLSRFRERVVETLADTVGDYLS